MEFIIQPYFNTTKNACMMMQQNIMNIYLCFGDLFRLV